MRTSNRVKSSAILSRTLATLALAFTLTLGSGCFLFVVGAGAAAGAGTVAYIKGELDATLPNNYNAVADASAKAIDEMHFALVSQSRDSAGALVTARTVEDTRIMINVEVVDTNLTKVRIRVGTFGDEALSRSILDQIKRNL
jgi:Protein of unknown function (DUF3568)